jgi:hypothetical protein
MFRKLVLAAAATAALGAAALSPTTASAQWGHRWHSGPSFGITIGGPAYSYGPAYGYGPAYAYAPRCWTQRRLVRTPWGARWRPVRVCR